MKKSILLTAVGILGTISLAGCGTNKGNKYNPGEKVKVGLICLHGESSTYDKNFIDGWKRAFLDNERVTFDESCIKTDIKEESDCYDAAKALVKQGCNMIFADSFGHGPYMKQAAQEFTNVQFCHATGTDALTAGLTNLHNAFASIYEGRYLAGYAAGLNLLQNGHSAEESILAGYVGAWPYAEVKSGYTAWFLGLREVFPNAKMRVEFTSSWYDETGEREKANALINADCVIISQHADSMGAPSACQEKRVPNITYNISTQATCNDTYVAYSAINWAPYFKEVTDSMFEGRVINGEVGNNWTGTFSTGSVLFDTTTNTKILNDANKQLLAQKKNELSQSTNSRTIIWDVKKFKVNPEKNPNAKVDSEGHLTSYTADTSGDYVPDKEVVLTEGGVTYFSESSFRSAPYFDIDIEGIILA